MEEKGVLKQLLAQVEQDKRLELTEKLQAAGSTSERVEILHQYGIKADDDMPSWLSDSYELSDEELDGVAGGAPWDYEVGTNCCS